MRMSFTARVPPVCLSGVTIASDYYQTVTVLMPPTLLPTTDDDDRHPQ